MKKRNLLKGIATGLVAATVLGGAAMAQEITLRLHQFLPPSAPVPAQILKPWGEAVEKASGGRIVVQHFDAMSLGGVLLN